MTKSTKKNLVNVINDIVGSFTLGFSRIHGARIVSNSMLIIFSSYMISKLEGKQIPCDELYDTLQKIDHQEVNSFKYIRDITYLIYITSLLDTFLSNITHFLMSLFPKSIGTETTVSISSILECDSKYSALNVAVQKKVKEIGYLPFLARIRTLDDKFGLNIKLDKDTLVALEHFTSVRNVMVHDQSIYEVIINDRGKLVSRQKTCPLHPTPITDSDLESARRAYSRVAYLVFKAIGNQVLKCERYKAYRESLEYLNTLAKKKLIGKEVK